MHDREIDVVAIARRRAELGLTLKQLAALASVSPSTLKYWAHGNREPRELTVAKIARALGCTIEDISTPRRGVSAAA